MDVYEYASRSREELGRLLVELDSQRRIVTTLLQAMSLVGRPTGTSNKTPVDDAQVVRSRPLRSLVLEALTEQARTTREILENVRAQKGDVSINTLTGLLAKMRKSGSIFKNDDGRWSS